MPDAPRELPYPGAKEMLLVEEVDAERQRILPPAHLDAEVPLMRCLPPGRRIGHLILENQAFVF